MQCRKIGNFDAIFPRTMQKFFTLPPFNLRETYFIEVVMRKSSSAILYACEMDLWSLDTAVAQYKFSGNIPRVATSVANVDYKIVVKK